MMSLGKTPWKEPGPKAVTIAKLDGKKPLEAVKTPRKEGFPWNIIDSGTTKIMGQLHQMFGPKCKTNVIQRRM